MIPLALSVLKLIKERGVPFTEITNFQEHQFKSLLLALTRDKTISIKNINEKVSNFISKKNKNTYMEIKKDLEICENNEIKCLSYFDNDFPDLLRKIKPTPKLLFLKGSIKPKDYKAVAIIGTRTPTQYGVDMTEKIAKRLTELGFTIVSGLARGIDTIAIKSALDNGGRAIGVIASGILNLYPKENKILVEKLVNNGALISERFPLKSVTKRALMIRNRITSGLGLGNIFVEGNKNSGTKWQLKYGKEQGRIPIAVKPVGDYEQAHIPNIVMKQEHGVVISDIKDIDLIAEMLIKKYEERKKLIKKNERVLSKQTNLFKYG